MQHVESACRGRLRSARRAVQVLHRLLRSKSETKEQQSRLHYQKLIETSKQMVGQTERLVPLVKGVIGQTHSCVLEGKLVASADSVPSLFDSHTRAIPRHKDGAEVEFGRYVVLDEVDRWIVTHYALLEQPSKHGQAMEAVAHHWQVFGLAPRLVGGNRGVHSPQTEQGLTEAGFKQVAIPASGKLTEARRALERTRR